MSPAVTDLLIDGPDDAVVTYAFAHGAGAPADSDFMTLVARALGQTGIRVVRFEFPYMAKHRAEGARRPPDRQSPAPNKPQNQPGKNRRMHRVKTFSHL